jgi:hypothetical protein
MQWEDTGHVGQVLHQIIHYPIVILRAMHARPSRTTVTYCKIAKDV